jgi:hypothetical protein
MKVELLTPLHIGTGNEIPEFEYHLDRDQLLRISLTSLIASDSEALSELDEFTTRDGVVRYLEKKSSLWDDHLLYYLNGEAQEFDATRQRDTAVRECIKASLDNYPLLPGSSLKGALLTGWLFGEGWEKLSQADQANLLQAAFTGFEISLDRNIYRRLTGRNPEWGLMVDGGEWKLLSDRLWTGDMELDGDLEIRKVLRHIKRGGEPHKLSTWVECIDAGATGAMFGRFRKDGAGPYKVEELCRRCNIFAKCQIIAEQQFADYCIEKKYLRERPAVYGDDGHLLKRLNLSEQTPNSCLVRIGWASNKNAASLTLMNSSANLSRQPANPEQRRPKSRWSLKDGSPLGWCLVTFEKDDYD